MRQRSALLRTVAVAALAFVVGGASAPHPDGVQARKTEMLNPVVRVETADGLGSGTVIHSGKDGVFILTNHHVMPKPEVADRSVKVSFWLYVDRAGPALPVSEAVEIVADDADKDLTLLRVTDPEWRTRYVAAALPADDHIEPTEPVFVVGAGLGHRVYATEGLVSLPFSGRYGDKGPLQEMLSAPTIFGNSGGAAFVVRDGHYVLAGVPEAIENAPGKIVPTPMAHMAFAITMDEVRGFLARNGRAGLIEG